MSRRYSSPRSPIRRIRVSTPHERSSSAAIRQNCRWRARREGQRPHAAKVCIDPVAHTCLERNDSVQPIVDLVHRGTHGPRGQVGLLGHLDDCDARGPENAHEDTRLVGEVLRQEGGERLVGRDHEMVVGIARDGAGTHGLEPRAHARHFAHDGTAGDAECLGELGAGAWTVVERPQELSLSLADHAATSGCRRASAPSPFRPSSANRRDSCAGTQHRRTSRPT